MVKIDTGDIISLVAGGAGAGVGIITALNVSAQGKNATWTTEQKFAAMLAKIIGPELSTQLTGQTFPGFRPGFNAFGAFNTSTWGGAALLVVDGFARKYAGDMGYAKVSRLVQAVGTGLLVGGIIGGIFDDPASDGLSPSQIAGLPSSNEVNRLPVRTDAVI